RPRQGHVGGAGFRVAGARGEWGEVSTPGFVHAVVGRIGVPTSNGTLYLPGSLPARSVVLLSVLVHATDRGDPPVGMGILTVEGDDIVLRGHFDVHTPRGRLARDIVRRHPRLGWSVAADLEQYL